MTALVYGTIFQSLYFSTVCLFYFRYIQACAPSYVKYIKQPLLPALIFLGYKVVIGSITIVTLNEHQVERSATERAIKSVNSEAYAHLVSSSLVFTLDVSQSFTIS